MTIRNFITFVSKNQIKWYMEENRTEEEEQEYFTSGKYEFHLTYLIETWVSDVKDEFDCDDELLDDANYDPLFDELPIFFNKEWLVDIFENNVLDNSAICLK